MKYPWADNPQKLQRAIEKANREQNPDKDKRIKELYVSFGGKIKDVIIEDFTLKNNTENNMNNGHPTLDETKEENKQAALDTNNSRVSDTEFSDNAREPGV